MLFSSFLEGQKKIFSLKLFIPFKCSRLGRESLNRSSLKSFTAKWLDPTTAYFIHQPLVKPIS
ncbi:hypothetical protein DB41_IB00630 [Neochlamydia sp. TUME1]|nr:hypothetical protein DB41_IB00630 [Neochlamydia sp. TUME1]